MHIQKLHKADAFIGLAVLHKMFEDHRHFQ
jgi:hypothetical protein